MNFFSKSVFKRASIFTLSYGNISAFIFFGLHSKRPSRSEKHQSPSKRIRASNGSPARSSFLKKPGLRFLVRNITHNPKENPRSVWETVERPWLHRTRASFGIFNFVDSMLSLSTKRTHHKPTNLGMSRKIVELNKNIFKHYIL